MQWKSWLQAEYKHNLRILWICSCTLRKLSNHCIVQPIINIWSVSQSRHTQNIANCSDLIRIHLSMLLEPLFHSYEMKRSSSIISVSSEKTERNYWITRKSFQPINQYDYLTSVSRRLLNYRLQVFSTARGQWSPANPIMNYSKKGFELTSSTLRVLGGVRWSLIQDCRQKK